MPTSYRLLLECEGLMPSRMLKKSASGVLAALPGGVKRETRVSRGTAALPAERRGPGRRGCLGRLRAGG